jgi:hypothetical protein
MPKRESIKERLLHDEGAWLKSLGEIGDIARMVLKLQSDVASMSRRQTEMVIKQMALERRLSQYETHTHKRG